MSIGDGTDKFRVYVSDDNSSWEPVLDGSLGNVDAATLPFPAWDCDVPIIAGDVASKNTWQTFHVGAQKKK